MVFGKIVKPVISDATREAFKEVMNRKGEDRYNDLGTEQEALLDEFVEFELRFQYKENFYTVLNRARGLLVGNVIREDGMIHSPSIEGYGMVIDTNQGMRRDSSDTMAFVKIQATAFTYLNYLAAEDYAQFDLLVHDKRTDGHYKLSDIADADLDESMLDNYTICAFGLKSVDHDTVYPD